MACDYICVTDLCKIYTNPLCETIITNKVSINQLYTFADVGAQSVQLLLTGVRPTVQSGVTDLSIRLLIYQIIPWFIMFLAIIIVLICVKSISPITGIVLIILLITVTALTIALVIGDVISVTTGLYDTIQNQITTNWQIYGDRIKCSLSEAIVDPEKLVCLTTSESLAITAGCTGMTAQALVNNPQIPVDNTTDVVIDLNQPATPRSIALILDSMPKLKENLIKDDIAVCQTCRQHKI